MNHQHNRIGAAGLGRYLPALLMLMMSSTTTTHAASYLQELEAEAAATEEAANGNTPDWPAQTPVGNGESIAKGLSKAQFEETLKARYYGSYLFYSTLNDAKQKVVYEEYKKDNDIKHLRQVIQSQMTN